MEKTQGERMTPEQIEALAFEIWNQQRHYDREMREVLARNAGKRVESRFDRPLTQAQPLQ